MWCTNSPVAIENDKDFEERLQQLCRMYRALREVWARTNAADTDQVKKWVVAGGRIVSKITQLLADLEDYTGSMDLRLILDELDAVGRERKSGIDRA